jgi:hypothetical protein
MPQNIKRIAMRILGVCISGLMVLQPGLAQQTGSPFGLKIVDAGGESRTTAVRQLSTQPPVVVVEDQSNQPVPNAIVVFTAPGEGPSGVFGNGLRSVTVTTDRRGRAAGLGFRANATAGSYPIQVTAQFLNETATGVITHTNIAPERGSGKLIAILAAVGGAAIGVVVATGGGGGDNGSSPNPGPRPAIATPTITFGGSAVGAPNR